MKIKHFVLLSSILFFSLYSEAFMTVQETAEISPMGQYKIGVEPQLKTSDGGGFNFSGFFDAALSEETSIRAQAGFGDTDFMAGGSFKWVPVPDYDRQPAIGGKTSVITWREASTNFVTFRIEPIVSKKFETESGLFTPYASLPFMFTSGNSKNTTGIQVAGGTEYHNSKWGNTVIAGELGIDAKDSFSYISAYVTFYLDDIKMKGN